MPLESNRNLALPFNAQQPVHVHRFTCLDGGGQMPVNRAFGEAAQPGDFLTDRPCRKKCSVSITVSVRRGRSITAGDVNVSSAKEIKEWLDAGLQHFVLRLAHPFDTKTLARVLKESAA